MVIQVSIIVIKMVFHIITDFSNLQCRKQLAVPENIDLLTKKIISSKLLEVSTEIILIYLITFFLKNSHKFLLAKSDQ